MRTFILLFSFLIVGGRLTAQRVSGLVTGTDGKPLAYASVYVKGKETGTFTNPGGRYTLSLPPGNHLLVCRYVGFAGEERPVTIGEKDVTVDFVLKPLEVTLGEVVVKSGEDPAYAIIRNAIRKRTDYRKQPAAFECKVYAKGQLSLRDYPRKFMGQKVDFEDGDTSKRKMIYLSETISRYKVQRPNREKVDVISSRVSGQSDGYGLSAPRFFSFYEDNVVIGERLNPRGFISPIAGNALNYYRYKLEGVYFEDGKMISRIRVTPKRKYEPLFSGPFPSWTKNGASIPCSCA